jgi:hypothetical protein
VRAVIDCSGYDPHAVALRLLACGLREHVTLLDLGENRIYTPGWTTFVPSADQLLAHPGNFGLKGGHLLALDLDLHEGDGEKEHGVRAVPLASAFQAISRDVCGNRPVLARTRTTDRATRADVYRLDAHRMGILKLVMDVVRHDGRVVPAQIEIRTGAGVSGTGSQLMAGGPHPKGGFATSVIRPVSDSDVITADMLKRLQAEMFRAASEHHWLRNVRWVGTEPQTAAEAEAAREMARRQYETTVRDYRVRYGSESCISRFEAYLRSMLPGVCSDITSTRVSRNMTAFSKAAHVFGFLKGAGFEDRRGTIATELAAAARATGLGEARLQDSIKNAWEYAEPWLPPDRALPPRTSRPNTSACDGIPHTAETEIEEHPVQDTTEEPGAEEGVPPPAVEREPGSDDGDPAPIALPAEPRIVKPAGFMDGLWPPVGLIGVAAEYAHAVLATPDRAAATAAAVFALGSANRNCCIGRSTIGCFPLNVYLLVIGKSGAGKDGQHRLQHRFARAMNYDESIIERCASGPALLNYLADEQSCGLATFILDEFGPAMMEALKKTGDQNHQAGLVRYLMQMHGLGLSTFGRSLYADGTANKEAIENPYLNVLATSTPSTLTLAVSNAQALSGFLTRFLSLPITDPLVVRSPSYADPPMALGRVFNFPRGNRGRSRQQTLFDLEPDALAAWEKFFREVKAMDDLRSGLWNRAPEYALRLAVLASLDLESRVVPTEYYTWAENLVRHAYAWMEGLREELAEKKGFAAETEAVLAAIAEPATQPPDSARDNERPCRYRERWWMHASFALRRAKVASERLPSDRFWRAVASLVESNEVLVLLRRQKQDGTVVESLAQPDDVRQPPRKGQPTRYIRRWEHLK